MNHDALIFGTYPSPTDPWFNTPPASGVAASREESEKLFNKTERARLQSIENRIGKLDVDFIRIACDSSYDAARQKVYQDEKLDPEEIVLALEKIEQARAKIPAFRKYIAQEMDSLAEQLRGPALKILEATRARVLREIEGFKSSEESNFWGIATDSTNANWFSYPMHRLVYNLSHTIDSLSRNEPEGRWHIRPILVDAGVIEPKRQVERF